MIELQEGMETTTAPEVASQAGLADLMLLSPLCRSFISVRPEIDKTYRLPDHERPSVGRVAKATRYVKIVRRKRNPPPGARTNRNLPSVVVFLIVGNRSGRKIENHQRQKGVQRRQSRHRNPNPPARIHTNV